MKKLSVCDKYNTWLSYVVGISNWLMVGVRKWAYFVKTQKFHEQTEYEQNNVFCCCQNTLFIQFLVHRHFFLAKMEHKVKKFRNC